MAPRLPAPRGVVVLSAVAAATLFLLAWALLHEGFWADTQIRDTRIYEEYGDAIARGELPYRDLDVEYPPAAPSAFVLPSLVVGAGAPLEDYEHAFEWAMLACGLALVALTALALAVVRADGLRLALGLGLVAISPLALGSVVLSRFDLWPAALTSASIAALLAGRNRLAGGVLAVAVAAKVYPAVLLPLVSVWVWRRRGRREAVRAGAVFAGVLAALVVPFVVLAPEGVADSAARQLGRPLQIESLGAAVSVALHHLAGAGVEVETSAGSQNVAGATGVAVGAAHALLQGAVLVWLWLRFARGPAEPERLLRYAAAAVLAFVALGKVLSPQFLLWLVPLVALVAGRRGLAAGTLLAVAMLLTQLWFPFRYFDYADDLDGTVTALVLARDLVLVVALGVLASPGWRR